MDHLILDTTEAIQSNTIESDTPLLLKRNNKKKIKFKKVIMTPKSDIETTVIELKAVDVIDKSEQAQTNLDPHLFTFRPKLNANSEILAQNLSRTPKKKTSVHREKSSKNIPGIRRSQTVVSLKTDDFNKFDDLTLNLNGQIEDTPNSNSDTQNDFVTTVDDDKALQEDVKLFRPKYCKKMSIRRMKEYITKGVQVNQDRLKMAKEEAERAIKQKKIFTIIGPYPALRDALRSRGWVEKFYHMNPLSLKRGIKVKKVSDDDDNRDDDIDDDVDTVELFDQIIDGKITVMPTFISHEDDGHTKLRPWEEKNGYFGILSRLVKNHSPTFIFTVKCSAVDYNYLSKDQLINHFNKNGCFTTKIGLCTNTRNVSWFIPTHADEFFPRCFKLSQEEDRMAFIDDYRLTACISLLKYALQRYQGEPDVDVDIHITSTKELNALKAQAESEDEDGDDNENENFYEETPTSRLGSPIKLNEQKTSMLPLRKTSAGGPAKSTGEPLISNSYIMKNGKPQDDEINGLTNRILKPKPLRVPIEAIEFAIERIQAYVLFRENEDIDKDDEKPISDDKWSQFYEWFYLACHDKTPIESIEKYVEDIEMLLESVQESWPQYHLDGTKSIWIVKPGAKSRGRGIIVFDKIENILELNTTSLQRDNKYVVQKYIERPLLIHNIKFDIRQWFLVTDFNPLTIWIYKDCYLRFCTQTFTLDDTKQSIHLCNYSIQKNFKNSNDRNQELPEENMWTNQQFIDKYLTRIGKKEVWNDSIYPGMKNAILCSMLSCQDIVEARKNSFELYGADFMITDNLQPWLIEINSSPTMARTTQVTNLLCDNVLDDLCKVVIDRKLNKNADIGRFELMYKGAQVQQPNYVGIDLRVDGRTYTSRNAPVQQQQQVVPKQVTSPRPFTFNTKETAASMPNADTHTMANYQPLSSSITSSSINTVPSTTTTLHLHQTSSSLPILDLNLTIQDARPTIISTTASLTTARFLPRSQFQGGKLRMMKKDSALPSITNLFQQQMPVMQQQIPGFILETFPESLKNPHNKISSTSTQRSTHNQENKAAPPKLQAHTKGNEYDAIKKIIRNKAQSSLLKISEYRPLYALNSVEASDLDDLCEKIYEQSDMSFFRKPSNIKAKHYSLEYLNLKLGNHSD